MTVYLASDFGKLILGYLESRGFTKSAEIMLEEFPELQEVALQRKKGQKVNLRIEGYTLLKMLNDFSHTKELVIENVEKYPSKFSSVKTILSLHEQVQTIINIAISNPVYNFHKKQLKKLGFSGENDPESTRSTCNISVRVGRCKTLSPEGFIPEERDSNELLFSVNNEALDNYQLEDCISGNTVVDQSVGVKEREQLPVEESNIILNDFSIANDINSISPTKRKGSVRKKTTTSPTNKSSHGLDSSQKKFLDTLMSDSSLHAKWADTINKRLENYPSHHQKAQTEFTKFEITNQPALISTNTGFCNPSEQFTDDSKNEISKRCLGLSDNNIRDLCLEFTNDLLMLPKDSFKNSSQCLPQSLQSTNNLCLETSNPDLESTFSSSRNLTTPIPQLSPSNNSFLSGTMFNTFPSLDEVNPSNSSVPGNMTFFEDCLPSGLNQNNISTNISRSSLCNISDVELPLVDSKIPIGKNENIASKPFKKMNDCHINTDKVNSVERPANSSYSSPAENNSSLELSYSSDLADKKCMQSTRIEKCETKALSNSTLTEDIIDSSIITKCSANVVESENSENNTPGGSSSFDKQNDISEKNIAFDNETFKNSKPNEVKSLQNEEDFAGVNKQNLVTSSIPITYSPTYPTPATAIPVTDSQLPKSVYFSGTPDHASNYTFTELTPLSPICRSENLTHESSVASNLSKLTKVEILGPSQRDSNSLSTAIVHTAMGESVITKIPSPDKNQSHTTITVIPVNFQNPNFQPIVPKLSSEPSRDIAEVLDELKVGRRRPKKDRSKENTSKLRKKKKVNGRIGMKKAQPSLKPIIPHGPNNILMEDDNQAGGTLVCNISEMGKKYTLPNCVSVSVPNVSSCMAYSKSQENNIIYSTNLSTPNLPLLLKCKSAVPESCKKTNIKASIPENLSKKGKKKKIKGKFKTTEKLLGYAIETALEFSSQQLASKEKECALEVKQGIKNICNSENNNLNNNENNSDNVAKNKASKTRINGIGPFLEQEICVNDFENEGSNNFATTDQTESISNRVSVPINPQMEFLVDKIEMGLIDEVLDNCGKIDCANDKNINNNTTQDSNVLPNSAKGSQLQSLFSFSKSFTLSNVQKRFDNSCNISPSLINRNHKGSFSTPRNKAHIRALDFGTPRKAFSSKKSAKRAKTSLSFSSPSPIKKLSVQNLKSQYRPNSLRKCQMESIAELNKNCSQTTEVELGNNDLGSLSQDLAMSDESSSLAENTHLPQKNLSFVNWQTPGKFPVCLEPTTPFMQAISSSNPTSCESSLNTPAPPFITTPGKSSLLKAYPQGPYSDSSEGTYYQPSERSVDMSDKSMIESEDCCSQLGEDLEKILIQTAKRSEEEFKSCDFNINCEKDSLKKTNCEKKKEEATELLNSNLCDSSIVTEMSTNIESEAITRKITNTQALKDNITSFETRQIIKATEKNNKKSRNCAKLSSSSASMLNPFDKFSNKITNDFCPKSEVIRTTNISSLVTTENILDAKNCNLNITNKNLQNSALEINAKPNFIKIGKRKKSVLNNVIPKSSLTRGSTSKGDDCLNKKRTKPCKEVKNVCKKIIKTRSTSKLSKKATNLNDVKLSKLQSGIKRNSPCKTIKTNISNQPTLQNADAASYFQPQNNSEIKLPGLTIEYSPSKENTIKYQNKMDDNLLHPVSESLIKDILNEEFKNKKSKSKDKVPASSGKKVFKNWGKQMGPKTNSKLKMDSSSSNELSKWYAKTKDVSPPKIQKKETLEQSLKSAGLIIENSSTCTSNVKSRSEKKCVKDTTDLSETLNDFGSTQNATSNKTPLYNSRSTTSGEEYMEIERQLEALDGKVFDSPAIREGLRNQDAEINLAEIFTPSMDTNKKQINFTPRKGDLHRSFSTTKHISFDSHSKSSMMHFTPLPQTPEKEVEEFCKSVVKDRIGLVAFPSSSRVLNFEQWGSSDFENRVGNEFEKNTKGNLLKKVDSKILDNPDLVKAHKNSNNKSFNADLSKICINTDNVYKGCELGNNIGSCPNAPLNHTNSYLEGIHISNQDSLSHKANSVSLSPKVTVGQSDHTEESFTDVFPNNKQGVSEDESDDDSNDSMPITLLYSPFIELLSLNLNAFKCNNKVSHIYGSSNESEFNKNPPLQGNHINENMLLNDIALHKDYILTNSISKEKVSEHKNKIHNLQRNKLVMPRSQNLKNSKESFKDALITDLNIQDTKTVRVKKYHSNKIESKTIKLGNLEVKKDRKSETKTKTKNSPIKKQKEVMKQVHRNNAKRKFNREEPRESGDPRIKRLKDEVFIKIDNTQKTENFQNICEIKKRVAVNINPKVGRQNRSSPKKSGKNVKDSKNKIGYCDKSELEMESKKEDYRKQKLSPQSVQGISSKQDQYLAVPDTPEKYSTSSAMNWTTSGKYLRPSKSILSFTDIVTFDDDNTSICTIPPTPGKDLFNLASSEINDTGTLLLMNEVPGSVSVSQTLMIQSSGDNFINDKGKEYINVCGNKEGNKLVGKNLKIKANCDSKTSMNQINSVNLESLETLGSNCPSNRLRRSERKKNQQKFIEKDNFQNERIIND